MNRANHKGAIERWNHTSKQLTLFKFKNYQAKVSSIAFSPDSQRLATSGDDHTIRLWDMSGKQLAVIKATTGKQITSFKGHKGRILQMLFSPDGELLVTRGEEGTARLWKSEGRSGYADNQWVVFTGHAGDIHSVAFSPDGKQLATGGADGTVRLWDTDQTKLPINFESGDLIWHPTGQILKTFRGHSGRVNIAFRPDGKQLAALGEDGILHLWDTTLTPIADSENDSDPLPAMENLDQLLSRNCDWVRDYLNNNPKVAQRDRPLCDGIATQN
jgi:WD40 repeat protein